MTTNEPQVSEENYSESQADVPLTVDTPFVNSSQEMSKSQNWTPDEVKSNEKPNTQAPNIQDPGLKKTSEELKKSSVDERLCCRMTSFDLKRQWVGNIPHLKLDFERKTSDYEHCYLTLFQLYSLLLNL